MRIFMRLLGLVLVCVWIVGAALPPVHAEPARQGTLDALVADITADGVGTVMEVHDIGSAVPIIIFEEYHTSVIGQVEIALMLNRLYRDYAAADIGLEGAFENLDGSWYYDSEASTAYQRAEVATALITEGEINNSEVMALVYPDVTVHGIEDEQQYRDSMVAASGDIGAGIYLLMFAYSQMTDAEQVTADEKYDSEGFDAYIDYILSFDAWAAERYTALYGCSDATAEDVIQVVDEIAARAEEEGYNEVPDFDEYRASMEQERIFFALASARSETMVQKTMSIAESVTAPVPIVIGAAHTDLMVQQFGQAGYSVAVIQSGSFVSACENTDATSLSGFAYDRKSHKLSVDAPGRLGSFLDGRDTTAQIKPETVIDEVFFQRKAVVYDTVNVLSEVLLTDPLPAAGDLPAPYGLGDTLASLAPEITIDPSSIEIVPADPDDPQGPPAIVFEFTLPPQRGSPAVTLWTKVARNDDDSALLGQLTTLRDNIPDYLEILLMAKRETLADQQPPVPVDPDADPDVEPEGDPIIDTGVGTVMTVAADHATVLNQNMKRGR